MKNAIVTAACVAFAVTLSAQWTPNGGADTAAITHSGNVGIGMTTAPLARLHVFTSASADGISLDGTNNPAIILRANGIVKGYGPAVATTSQAYFLDATVGDIAFRSESNRLLFGRGSGYSTMVIAGPSVGINTVSPLYPLDVTGDMHVLGNFHMSTNAQLQISNALIVREGTTNARSVLRAIPDGVVSTVPATMEVFGTDYAVDTANFERFSIRSKGTADDAYILFTDAFGSGQVRPIRLTTGTNLGLNIDSSGNISIGKSAPDAGYALDVNGTVRGTNVLATYQDVAEWVPSGGSLPAGTVVVLNRAKSNEVMPSTKSYDTAIAGVVSAQPGVLLGTAGDNKAKIATTGRVKVRVDATKSPVNVGDLLVTSDVPGTAMVSVPIDLGGVKIHRPGTLIGKALEPLASGEGGILVLLSLQ